MAWVPHHWDRNLYCSCEIVSIVVLTPFGPVNFSSAPHPAPTSRTCEPSVSRQESTMYCSLFVTACSSDSFSAVYSACEYI